MYSMPYLYNTKLFHGKLDNYLQFVIRNPDGFTYHGQEVSLSATIVNVDGMFLIFPNLIGDPDIRLELSLEQAMQLYKYIVYEAVEAKTIKEKIDLFKKYSKIVEECTVYERSWH